MAFEISGFVLEGIRVGQSNATFTPTPANYVSDPDAFGAAYPQDESAPRTDYLVLVTSEGTPRPGLLECAGFGFTKNDVVSRFGYDPQVGGFRPLRGAAPVDVGVLSKESNTTRLHVRPPAQAEWINAAPYRLAVGANSSGETWSVEIVATDDEFGNDPPTKTAKLSLKTGNLHWNSSDLDAFVGQRVRFQQQQYYEYRDSNGNLGTAPIATTDVPLVLNPLPGPGQFPQLRFGYGLYLKTEQVASENDFYPPATGTVQWARNTGRLNFNVDDAQWHAGTSVYYDGVLFANAMVLPSQQLGKIENPNKIVGLPPTGVDLIFSLPGSSPYHRFPTVTYRAKAAFTSGKAGEVQVDPTNGEVRFSNADRSNFAGQDVTLYFGDLPLERGISVRLLRNPVNLDAALLTQKDVTAIYEVVGATWADPIIQSPQVSLPSLPIQDPGYKLVVQILQGQGSYLDDDFPDLSKPPDPNKPPPRLGYYIDFDAAALVFAERKDQVTVQIQTVTSDVVLPDPLVRNLNLTLVGSGPPKPLTIGDDALVDATSGVVSLASTHTRISEGTGEVVGTMLEDSRARFLTDGVQAGQAIVLAGVDVYTVASVQSETMLELDQSTTRPSVTYSIYDSREILADRYFDEVVLLDPSTKVERIRELGSASNSDRLNIPPAYADSSGFRLGPEQSSRFATVVVLPNDASFGVPPTGTVELSRETGNLNFAAVDLGTLVYWSRELVPKVDYLLQPELGLVQFTERMLAGDEARIQYTVAPPLTVPPTQPGPPLIEYATFLIRKELTKHEIPTSTIPFNLAGRPVALEPPPAVFRGGRPQKLGEQCTVDALNSQITFLSDSQLTDALPHGATVNPNERVYIDYYVTRAVGGEKTFTVLHPPISTSAVQVRELNEFGLANDRFRVSGDWTSRFPRHYLMRIEAEQIYLIDSATYDAATNETTVIVTQPFQDSFSDPKIYVASGPTPIEAEPLAPPYFAYELELFEAIPRGSNTFLLPKDQSLLYRTGTVVLFTDPGSTFADFLQVTGASYDPTTDRTTVMLSGTTPRQYMSGPEPDKQLLLRSVRPVFEPPVLEAQTSLVPKLTEPHVVYRRVAGKPGKVLVSPEQYTIDDSGHVVFKDALGLLEEFAIFYSGLTTVPPGSSLQASYTCQIAPSVENGLLGQTMLANYAISSPDSFYFRVETMTNFRGEYATEIAAAASSGSSGPQTSNASQPELFEQGRKSLYFDERHLANQDIVARSSLLFYNDLVGYLEDYRRTLDGRVVGNNDGPFLFDGSVDGVHLPGEATNQIDDLIKVSDAPYKTTYPPFAVQSVGTYKKYYLPSPLSRFYPTAKDFFAVPAIGAKKPSPGQEVVDTKSTNITSVSDLHTRLAWAVVTEPAPQGASILKVDFALGTEPGFADQAAAYARPPFGQTMQCVVQKRNGEFINSVDNPITLGVLTANQLAVSNLAGDVDIGDTVYRSPVDASTQSGATKLTSYVPIRDYSFNMESGQITYVETSQGTPLVAGQALSGKVRLNNSLTEPFRIPALYGGVEDDDGDLSFPIQNPDPDNEQFNYLSEETKSIAAIRAQTTPPIVSSTGRLSDQATIIDDAIKTMATLPVPPKVDDLVRIISGPNGNPDSGDDAAREKAKAFRRVVALQFGMGSIGVTPPFDIEDTGTVTYEIAVSPEVESGTVSGLAVPGSPYSSIVDGGSIPGHFLTKGVKVGHTLTIAGSRRFQITKVVSNTELWFTPSTIYNPTNNGYKIEKSLATFGLPSGTPVTDPDYPKRWKDALAAELELYPIQQTKLQAAIELAFTTVTTGSRGEVVAGQNTLVDLGAPFSQDVQAGHCVYISSGLNIGAYEIAEVVSPTKLIVQPPYFATTESAISYQIASRFGLTLESIQSLIVFSQAIESLLASAEALLPKFAPIRVLGFSNEGFATSLLQADMDTRESQVTARLAALPSNVQEIEDILAGTEKLYDQRYVWIDTRINLESGLLVRQAQAVANRIKTQAEQLKQLTKLLAVEGA